LHSLPVLYPIMTNTTPSNNDSSPKYVVPSEVGWQFVPQYYTHVNESPHRLHCFYNKTSTFIHGTEGEDGTPCYGQQEIHNKITSIGFEDCKVFIHSVDAQSSANGGIIIQVIGEMSNRGEPWKKFVQTFFLAEQPNGYFVLNDIFRFLKEDVESDEGEPEQVSAEAEAGSTSPQQEAAPILSPAHPQPASLAADIPVAEPVRTASPTPSAPPAEEVPTVHESPAAEPHANGHLQTEEQEATDTPASAPAEKSLTPEPEPAPAVESPAPSASPAPPPASSLAPAQSPAPAAPSQPAPAPAPAPAPPPVPKTWANLAATNSKKWGSAVAQESRGTSEVPAASSSSPGSGTQTPVSHHAPGSRPQQQPREPHPSFVAATNVSNGLCFVKSVQENVTEPALRNTLVNRFGTIKDLDLVRSKACAFLEFTSADSARRAIIASLPTSQGGEGGIRIDLGDGQHARITVETRKERGERPVSRPRGGVPVNGDIRGGGFRGGRGSGPGRGGGRGLGQK